MYIKIKNGPYAPFGIACLLYFNENTAGSSTGLACLNSTLCCANIIALAFYFPFFSRKYTFY